MSFLRGSANYVWCTTSVLGKGATGAVFRGVSKHDGEPVAVKTFNQLSHMRPQEVQVREFEVLKKVKHENIVKLLAIEEEQDARGKVIVMELCTGGSLFNILDDPENTYGIAEDEFLLVLEHLTAGMKHLRDKNLIHRDLKPGNIMKFIAEDGRIIYKLTDFGAARELEEDGEFMSLYGTEEYLHPDMYEKAVLRKPVGKTYSAFVDLWSIGVTLFHVATGTLPFRPYGGRKNKEMMYYIVTKKESGVISGSQTTENGDIDWKRELPPTTQLSAGLKIFLIPLLAGLMEVDPRKRWSFEKFFSAVTALLKKRKLHLFYVNKIQSLRIYIDSEDEKNLMNLQCLIMEQTDISPENQILLYKDSCLSSKPDPELPDTTDQNPLILCHRENNNITIDWDNGASPKETALPKFPNFPNLVNVENDAVLAKQCCAIGCSYQRRIDKIVLSVKLINNTVHTIVEVIMNELSSAHKDSTQVQNLISSLSQQLRLMTTFYKSTNNFFTFTTNISNTVGVKKVVENKDKLKTLQGKIDLVGKSVEAQQEEFGKLAAHLQSLEQPIKQLFNRFVDNRILITEWEDATHDIKDISLCGITASSHVAKLRESWQHLLRDRATRNLTYNDEQFHILERIKMQEKAKALTNLVNEDCQNVVIRLTELLSDWYKTAQAAFIQTEILAKDMNGVEESIQEFQSGLNNTVDSYESELESVSHGLKHYQNNLTTILNERPEYTHTQTHSNQTSLDTGYGQPPSGTGTTRDSANLSRKSNNSHSHRLSSNSRSSNNKEYVRTFNRGLKELTNVQEEVWNILKENAELVNQFQTLTLSILTPSESTKVGSGGEGILTTMSSYESAPNSKNGSLSSNKSD